MDPASFLPLLLAANRYRLVDYDFPRIGGWASEPFIVLGIVILSFVAGVLIANAARMRDYGWKIGLILSTFLVSLFVVAFGDISLGVDLKGGVILVYEVDEEETRALTSGEQAQQWSMSEVVQVIGQRLNPEGLREIVVRPFGPRQIEIVVPEADPAEIEKIKEIISTGGVLEFLIVAGPVNEDLLELARQKAEQTGRERLARAVLDAEGRRVGHWARLGREEGPAGTVQPFRALDILQSGFIRDAQTGEIIELTDSQRLQFSQNNAAFQRFLDQRGVRNVDVLLVVDPDFQITGSDLATVRADRDDTLSPMISFTTRGDGVFKMQHVTRENLKRKLAIVFDNTLLSAPVIQSTISDRGQITGRFTQEEVNFVVNILRSGSMPVVLKKQPISENQIGSILGYDTIIKGGYSVAFALLGVLAFMAFYYRFAGLVSCFALVLNLLLTIGIMIILRAPLTLPGIAGLVLTVGMSVDGNILIFERMREELARNATFRMAIRNGFDKALSAIIDGNVTTLLTAAVLYLIGTDQVRGFGITLILGNITGMYATIFVAHVIFDVVERTRLVKTVKMMQLLSPPKIDWVRWFRPATITSLVLITVGLIGTAARGKGLFDTDLAGGTSVTFILKEPTPVDEVRARLEAVLGEMVDEETQTRVGFDVYEMSVQREQPQTVYKVDSSLPDIELLKSKVREALRLPSGEDGIRTVSMEIGQIEKVEPNTDASLFAPGTRSLAPGGGLTSPFGPAPPTTAPGSTAPPAQGTDPGAPAAPATPDQAQPGEATNATPSSPPTPDSADSGEAADKEPSAHESAPTDNQPGNDDASAPNGTNEDQGEAESGTCGQEESEKGADEQTEENAAADDSRPQPAESDAAASQPATPGESAASEPAAATTEQAAPTTTDPAAAEATPAPSATGEADPEPAPAPATQTDATPATAEAAPQVGTPPPPAPTSPAIGATPEQPVTDLQTKATLRFPGTGISGEALQDRLAQSAMAVLSRDIDAVVHNPDWDPHDNTSFTEWTVTLPLDVEQARQVLEHMQQTMEGEVAWQTSSSIGGQVSADTQQRAFWALVASVIMIVAYIWIRFQKVAWGLAAIAAIVHDALVMLAAIALSYWVAPFLGFLGVEEFKISLAVVAAFLTIIGYSVNDTIVIFDRLREIRGKSPTVTKAMINDAVNLTLGRTILTNGMTLMVVIALYIFGGPGIHAFAFALLIGMIAGTYSTMYIASPLLLWLLNRQSAPAAATAESRGFRQPVG